MANLGSMKIFVARKMWNGTTSRVKGCTAEALSVNVSLDAISIMLHSIYCRFENHEGSLLDKISSAIIGENKESTTFLPVFDKFIEDREEKVQYKVFSKEAPYLGFQYFSQPHETMETRRVR